MDAAPKNQSLQATASSEIYIKSQKTRQRFMPMLLDNLRTAVSAADVEATVKRHGNQKFDILSPDLNAAAAAVSTVFGIERVDKVESIPAPNLETLAANVAAVAGPRVAGNTFAARVKRIGSHTWRSKEGEVAIGNALYDRSAGVDLSNPDVLVQVRVENDTAAVVAQSWRGPGGLPVGSQTRVLLLLSGGIDSPVAGWMMLRRGCPIDMLHFQLECNQADHALAVGHQLATRWGHGADINLHVIDFEPVKKELNASAHSRLRQVLLKQLMTEAGHRVAQRLDIPLMATGDSLGQVSSQTAHNLVEIDKYAQAPLLRPLVAHSKQEIVDRAREIGTFELSTRAREVCDLSEGRPVETAAATYRLRKGMSALRDGLIDDALATWETVPAADWFPGIPLTPLRSLQSSPSD